MKKVYNYIATVFGVGFLPLAPGTWGSVVGLLLCLLLHGNLILYLSVFVALFVLGTVSAGKVEKESGTDDPPFIVIDECACIFAAYFLIPLTLPAIITGFVLYRLFDIIKVPPMRLIEKRIKGGSGIMLDDLIAGIYTNILLRVFLAIVNR